MSHHEEVLAIYEGLSEATPKTVRAILAHAAAIMYLADVIKAMPQTAIPPEIKVKISDTVNVHEIK